MRYSIITATVLIVALSCTRQSRTNDSPEAVLAQMRADTCWIHKLDSLAQLAIGPGAKCIDLPMDMVVL